MENAGENGNKLKGAKIRTANYTMILVASILYLFILYGMFQISSQYNDLLRTTDKLVSCEEIAANLADGSNILTEQVRLYTVTAEMEYMEAYFQEANVDKRRDRALEKLSELPEAGDEVHILLQMALNYSNALMKSEIYAMGLVSEAKHYDTDTLPKEVQEITLSEEDQALDEDRKIEKAQDLVFGYAYREAKEKIMNNISDSLESVLDETKRGQDKSKLELKKQLGIQRVKISVLFVMNVFIFFFITILIVKPLQVYIRCIKDHKALEITGAYEFKYLALTYNDIYEVNAANETMLREKAEKDALTGILNRGAFDQIRAKLKASPAAVYLLLIDVDIFKKINDTYGHEMGDRALKRVAELLIKSFRATDFQARIGGDEFAVIMTEINKNSKEIIISKVEQMNEILQRGENGLPKFSLSVGAAFSRQGFDDELYRRADQALYRVKETGRCGYAFYEDL